MERLDEPGRQHFEAPAVRGGPHDLEPHGNHPQQTKAVHRIPRVRERLKLGQLANATYPKVVLCHPRHLSVDVT